MPNSSIPNDPLHYLQTCEDVTIEGLYHGLFTGAVYGMIMSRQIRLNSPSTSLPNPSYFTRVIRPSLSMSLYSSLMFGSVLSIYNYSSCKLKVLRNKHDMFNSMGGGVVAGVFISLPNILLHKGYKNKSNWKILGINTAVVGGIGCLLHFFSQWWNPKLVQSIPIQQSKYFNHNQFNPLVKKSNHLVTMEGTRNIRQQC